MIKHKKLTGRMHTTAYFIANDFNPFHYFVIKLFIASHGIVNPLTAFN